jgi:hypothetical protein
MGGTQGGGNLELAAECFIDEMKHPETVPTSDVMQVLCLYSMTDVDDVHMDVDVQ